MTTCTQCKKPSTQTYFRALLVDRKKIYLCTECRKKPNNQNLEKEPNE